MSVIFIFTVAVKAHCVFMPCVDYSEAEDLGHNEERIKAVTKLFYHLPAGVCFVGQHFVAASAHISVQPSPVIRLLKAERSCSTKIRTVFVAHR